MWLHCAKFVSCRSLLSGPFSGRIESVRIGRSSNGRTAAFEAVNLGSIPSLPAKNAHLSARHVSGCLDTSYFIRLLGTTFLAVTVTLEFAKVTLTCPGQSISLATNGIRADMLIRPYYPPVLPKHPYTRYHFLSTLTLRANLTS